MRYKQLITVEDIYQAQRVSHALEVEGIRCIVANEHSTTLFPNFTGMMGAGIQILVAEHDYVSAAYQLDKLKAEEAIKCPNCQSEDIDYGVGEKNMLARMFGVAASLFFVPTTTKFNFIYRCKKCGEEFRKSAL